MDGREFTEAIPVAGTASPSLRDAERKSSSSSPAAVKSNDGVLKYTEKSVDFEGLAGDIKALVTERIQMSIPDEQKLMLDLISQIGELTGEVRQLRKQLDCNAYALFAFSSGQTKDITSEIVELQRLLDRDPVNRELGPDMLESIIAQSTASSNPEKNVSAEQPAPASVSEPSTEAASAQQTDDSRLSKMNPDVGGQQDIGVGPGKAKKKRAALSVIGNILFYVMIVGIIFGAFLVRSGSGGQPTVIAGYSAFTVLTSSMEDTYPKGSLIITQRTDADELQIGDDITYMVSKNSSITHRIIGITENYLDTGDRAFETQGTMNEKPDKDPVAAANVVGKVIFCSLFLGQMAAFVTANWPILLFAIAVLTGLFAFLKWNFRREDESEPRVHKRRKQGG